MDRQIVRVFRRTIGQPMCGYIAECVGEGLLAAPAATGIIQVRQAEVIPGRVKLSPNRQIVRFALKRTA